MILIFTSPEDDASQEVERWVESLGFQVMIITPRQISVENEMFIDFKGGKVIINNEQIEEERIKGVWFRKWYLDEGWGGGKEPLDKESLILQKWLKGELKELSNYLYSFFPEGKWLCHPNSAYLNKLIQSKLAFSVGLEVPDSFITTNWENEGVDSITKVISTNVNLNHNGNLYGNYTVDSEQGSHLFPSLIQEKIEKEYEIRVFYIKGEFFSMAIFSQNDEQTKTDFRVYNHDKPNRMVPYSVDKEIEEKLRVLMGLLKLNTGSIDLLRCKKTKKVFFLEVNPQGQFGMVSKACNYYLERKVAIELNNM